MSTRKPRLSENKVPGAVSKNARDRAKHNLPAGNKFRVAFRDFLRDQAVLQDAVAARVFGLIEKGYW